MMDKNIVPTNADAVLGREARVTEAIDNTVPSGAVYVDGKTWSARSESGETLPEGTLVRAVRMEGVKLFSGAAAIKTTFYIIEQGGKNMFVDINIGTVALAILVVLILILIVSNIQIVQQSKAYVVERLGAFHAVWGVGLHLKVPFIERVVKKVSLKEQVADFDPQPVITKDNVTMQIDTVIYFQITDPKLYTYGVEYPMNAIENLTATTLRNIIGELELDQSLTSRDTINAKMRAILDEATDPWGIKVNRVELKNILPPREIQNAMEKQMKAERERRESILQAEGEKASKILVAEGEKQSAILKADAQKQARIMQAEGEATAILKVQQAMADSLKLLNEAAPNDQVIKLKALEALEKVADGKATKLIIPSEIQGLAGLAASAKTILSDDKPEA